MVLPEEALTTSSSSSSVAGRQFGAHQRRVEGGIEPAMSVAKIGTVGDAPAQIENAARL